MKRPLEIKYMQMALRLAKKGEGRTYPNPMVGAVIVRDGKIVGRGYHKKAGEDHAEITALKEARGKCRGASMFVTLEPCDHYGKTPPCSLRIIESGIKTVYASMKDPNRLTGGKGINRLKKAGIDVKVGLMREESAFVNRKYIKFITTGLPYVTVKLAQSIDGKIAARDGSSKWISGEDSRNYTRKLRPSYDAIMVGANTVVKDDPYLLDSQRKGYGVTRIVVDSRLRIPEKSNILKTRSKSPVIIATTRLAPQARMSKLEAMDGIEVIRTRVKEGRVSLGGLLKKLGQREMVNVLVEGGGELVGSMVDEGLVDEAMFFVSPKIIGGEYSSVKGKGAANIKKALDLEQVEIKRKGDDIFVRGMVCSRG
ncbi:MAG: bifunctional diaminohydroxyphosphoribosylaminopyrimidine deaminase/5-amino-6-(5-phosphoribosylamino)uracil reductase RibD [Candidatus Omnitrophica bacterium]|nr:bifunctional diaminohydroxyphosphoribosylaminopyrimidine deaminase/5-amino-6-(5-phosphoribosylamino)uracil reductase RibD [Candidatus Omnitrophota bacterium]